jgi:hypothetical protein
MAEGEIGRGTRHGGERTVKKEISTGTGTLWVDEDGIVRVHVSPGARLTLAETKENLATLDELQIEDQRPLLVDIREMHYIDRESRELFASATGVSAVAVLIGSPISKVIGSLFIGLNRTSVPIKLCTSESEAIEWLKGYLP